jgi:hypothetical protein
VKFQEFAFRYIGEEGMDVEFRMDTFCISEMFLRLLGKYEVGPCKAMRIELISPTFNHFDFVRDEFVNMHEILSYNKDFDLKAFQKLAVEEKKLCLWNIIYELMTKAALQYGWEQETLKNTYEKGLKAGLKNEFYYKDFKISPDRNFKAIIRVDFQMKTCFVYADFFTKEGEFIGDVLLIEWEPIQAEGCPFMFKNASWNKDHCYVLSLKSGRTYSAKVPM